MAREGTFAEANTVISLFSTKLIPVDSEEVLSIEEAASRLGLHYMTVYRYVRTGRLSARYRDGRWQIQPVDLDRLSATPARGRASTPDTERAASHLLDRLLAGDGAGAWRLVENVLASLPPQAVYLQILAPCLRAIGDRWESGRISIGDEHRATAVALGIVGRLGPGFTRRGRRRGNVLLAGAEGDPHAIPVLMVGDVMRAAGFNVIQLGADVPTDSLVAMADSSTVGELTAVGLSASTEAGVAAVARSVVALHRSAPGVPILAGGPAVPSRDAAAGLGADGWAGDAAGAAEAVQELARAGRRRATPTHPRTVA